MVNFKVNKIGLQIRSPAEFQGRVARKNHFFDIQQTNPNQVEDSMTATNFPRLLVEIPMTSRWDLRWNLHQANSVMPGSGWEMIWRIFNGTWDMRNRYFIGIHREYIWHTYINGLD